MKQFRQSTQEPAPAHHEPGDPGAYDIYPSFPIGAGRIGLGFDALAGRIISSGVSRVIIDGFVGVLWEWFASSLEDALSKQGAPAHFYSADRALKSEEEIIRMIGPFLGGDDPIFGTRSTLPLSAFFDPLLLTPPPAKG
ncbi:MAG TPA: hypothetical protein VF514_07580, partial [Bacteroidota bacterium]